jgi:hypothetical protein
MNYYKAVNVLLTQGTELLIELAEDRHQAEIADV